MEPVEGWTIWTTTGVRIRLFTVALVDESTAAASVKVDNPDVEILSSCALATEVIQQLGMVKGDITEWVPLDCKLRLVSGSRT